MTKRVRRAAVIRDIVSDKAIWEGGPREKKDNECEERFKYARPPIKLIMPK